MHSRFTLHSLDLAGFPRGDPLNPAVPDLKFSASKSLSSVLGRALQACHLTYCSTVPVPAAYHQPAPPGLRLPHYDTSTSFAYIVQCQPALQPTTKTPERAATGTPRIEEYVWDRSDPSVLRLSWPLYYYLRLRAYTLAVFTPCN